MPHTAPAHAPVLTIDVEMVGTVPVVHCHGRLVLGATSVLYDGVRELIPHSKRIILDLTDLKHTDSMGIGTLVRLYVSAKGAGCSLELVNLSGQIRNLLGITNVLSLFTVIGENGVRFL
jgi:anti-sigma B factor antagonist